LLLATYVAIVVYTVSCSCVSVYVLLSECVCVYGHVTICMHVCMHMYIRSVCQNVSDVVSIYDIM